MIRPLGAVLAAIIKREDRVAIMREKNLPETVIQSEREIINSLKEEYHSRVARLSVYMGVA